MNTLDKIVARKREEVEAAKKISSIKSLENSVYFARKTHNLREFILNSEKSGIICEFKRKSPSKGIINDSASVLEVTTGYAQAGASALSILTDASFFGGSKNDLLLARPYNNLPILRKDFMIDAYQIVESKALGADVILLIAECLTKKEVLDFAKLAKSLNMSVLMEVHSEEQLKKINSYLDAVGVNNRNLKNFYVDIETSVNLINKIPDNFIKISESGISTPETITYLKSVGYQGFLIGENFMKTENPAKSCATFIKALKH